MNKYVPSITDVCFFGIFNSTGKCYFSMNFDNIDQVEMFSVIETDSISVYQDKPLLVEIIETEAGDRILITLLCKETANELFVKNALDNFILALEKIMKKWTLERIETKYDLIVILCHEFLYNGTILEDSSKELFSKVEKRTFESVKGIKMQKGLASMLSNAAKNVKDSFHK